jgi:hypothetical protein
MLSDSALTWYVASHVHVLLVACRHVTSWTVTVSSEGALATPCDGPGNTVGDKLLYGVSVDAPGGRPDSNYNNDDNRCDLYGDETGPYPFCSA